MLPVLMAERETLVLVTVTTGVIEKTHLPVPVMQRFHLFLKKETVGAQIRTSTIKIHALPFAWSTNALRSVLVMPMASLFAVAAVDRVAKSTFNARVIRVRICVLTERRAPDKMSCTDVVTKAW